MEMPHDYIRPKIKSAVKEAVRRISKQKLPRPDTARELRELVEAQDPQPACSCDQCDAHSYKSHWICKTHPHDHPKPTLDTTRNQFGNECYKPLKMNMALRSEAMEVTRAAVQYFDRPLDSLNNTQLAALTSLRAWIRDNMSMLFPHTPSTSPTSLDKIFSTSSMRELWAHINLLFFGPDMPHRTSSFRWSTRPSRIYKSAIGLASYHVFLYNITITPELDGIAMLGVLLHEACHMFFMYHACPVCHHKAHGLERDGHGHAWQILASAVERKCTDFTGFSISLIRLDSLRHHWGNWVPLPSLHDLAAWDFDKELLICVYWGDLVAAVRSHVEYGGKVEEFPLRGFGEYWWVDTEQAESRGREGKLGGGMELYPYDWMVKSLQMVCGVVEVDGEVYGEVEQEGLGVEDVKEM